ncbi:hypothetical protein EYF80_036445 [Liparis tanakae]|uniref:Uncharacterized protein n=1 Tax=Liparis tanakae TaxID=230148 RepID=A0A4Z2GIL4_9TELE|nr:hypothetical protein EYF80_036445 [Liparis tanakae]
MEFFFYVHTCVCHPRVCLGRWYDPVQRAQRGAAAPRGLAARPEDRRAAAWTWCESLLPSCGALRAQCAVSNGVTDPIPPGPGGVPLLLQVFSSVGFPIKPTRGPLGSASIHSITCDETLSDLCDLVFSVHRRLRLLKEGRHPSEEAITL